MDINEIVRTPAASTEIPLPQLLTGYAANISWAIDRLKKSTAGIRGTVDITDIAGGRQLNAAVVLLMAQAYADYVNSTFSGPMRGMFVGFDPRYWSKEYAQLITRVLLANGIKVYRDRDESPTSTPATSFMAYHLKVAGGIEVTSSHNPPDQNGIKSMTSYGGVDTDDVSGKIASCMQKLYSDGRAGKGVIKVAAYDTAKIVFIDAKEIYFDNYLRRLFTPDTVAVMTRAMDAGARFIFDGLYGVGGPSAHYYLSRLFPGYSWKEKILLMNDSPDPRIGNIQEPDPSRPATLEYSGVLAKLTEKAGVLVAVTADMDADRIGTAVIIPEADVPRAKRYGLFVSRMEFGGKSVDIVRFTPNQIFTLIAYENALKAYQKKIGSRDISAIDAAIRSGRAPKLVLFTSIPSSMIAKAMIERLGGCAGLTTVGFKNLGYQAMLLDARDKESTIVALMEESGGANVGPIDNRDERGSSIHRDKDTIALAFSLYAQASDLFLKGRNLLDAYADMAQALGSLCYYERLDAYLPTKKDSTSTDPALLAKADGIKAELIRRFRAIDLVKEEGKSGFNLDDAANVKALASLFGKDAAGITKTHDAEVPGTTLLIEEGGAWKHVAPVSRTFYFSDGEAIEVFHTGRADQEGPSITLFDRSGKIRARTLMRPSGTESLVRVYMEIFEPKDAPRPQHLYEYFTPLLEYLGLKDYRLKEGGPDYVSDYIDSVKKKYGLY